MLGLLLRGPGALSAREPVMYKVPNRTRIARRAHPMGNAVFRPLFPFTGPVIARIVGTIVRVRLLRDVPTAAFAVHVSESTQRGILRLTYASRIGT